MNIKKTIALLLILSFVATTMMTLPNLADAQSAPRRKTFPIIDAIPNPVGVGQETLIKTGILLQAEAVEWGWEGLTVTVTDPDGETQTLGPFKTDSTGSTYTLFTPTKEGNYTLVTDFPEQTVKHTYANREEGYDVVAGTILEASTSESLTLVVQAEPLPDYPGHPLPTEYWSRPIDPQLREWYAVSGNWVYRPDNSLAPFNDDAPETAHVLWANPLTTGGLMGGLWGDGQVPSSAEGGDAYEGKFPGSVILNGILYYQRTDSRREQAPAIIAVDLHTGEEWMFRNNTVLSFGQILYFNSYNYDGTFSYIWSQTGSTYTAYDPFTGNQQIQITNVPSGTRFFGPSGEILILQVDYTAGWMALWNSTDCGLQNAEIGTPDYGSWGNTAHGTGQPGRYGTPGLEGDNPRSYSWNVTIPSGITSPTSGIGGAALKVYPNDRVVGMTFNRTNVNIWALNLASGQEGKEIFKKSWTPPASWNSSTVTQAYTGASNYVTEDTYGNGVMALWIKEERSHYGFSVVDGSFLWNTPSEHYADAYGWGNAEHTWYFAYGNLYSTGVGGILYAYDLTNGDIVWTYELSDPYNEPVTGENWWGWIDLITDGKLYVGTLEHSAEQPVPRGAPFICINATDGSEIWRVNGMFRQTRWGGNGVIGDSIIATMDTYDQRVYAIGKGASALTATAPDVSVDFGKSVVIKGTVTDISPGTAKYALTSRFPNGVPAVSDEDQSEWMLYVYKQFDRPNNVTGVPVSIDVIDANNNFRNIGATTSDSTGYYSFDWVPDISGKYTVIVTFAGSDAYYPSFAQNSFVVNAAPDATQGPTDGPGSMTDAYFVPAVVGIIIAILVVGAILAMLLLRKRP